MPTFDQFKPAWWLPGPHLQTIWSHFAQRKIHIQTERERIELPDGDFIDLDWSGPTGQPIVVLLHGLGGSIDSHYSKPMIKMITDAGWRALFFNFRGASGSPNRLPRFYHAGDTSDVDYVISKIKERESSTPISVIGISIGGNILLKWLGETAANNPIHAAIAISVPFELMSAAKRFEKGFSKIYQWWLLQKLKECIDEKAMLIDFPEQYTQHHNLKTFWEFDDKITAPLHGFENVNDYYHKASCRPYLSKIQKPTLIIHSIDDPFMLPHVIPEPHEFSQFVKFELSKRGGHVGFISGRIPGRANYWLEKRIPEFFDQYFKTDSDIE